MYIVDISTRAAVNIDHVLSVVYEQNEVRVYIKGLKDNYNRPATSIFYKSDYSLIETIEKLNKF